MVADHDSGIRIAKLKMADPRWRLCDSNVEFFEQFARKTLYGGFWSRRLQIWCQNCKFQNSGYKKAPILLEFWSFRTIDTKLAVWVFFGSPITIMKSELENSKSGVWIGNSKWRIQNGGYISANSQFFCNCAETWYMRVFGVADYESGVRIVKFKMEDWKWRWC